MSCFQCETNSHPIQYGQDKSLNDSINSNHGNTLVMTQPTSLHVINAQIRCGESSVREGGRVFKEQWVCTLRP